MSERPADFRYRERERGRTARWLRRASRALGFDPAPSEVLLSAFEEAYFLGDPLAEAVVRAARSPHAARAELDRALAALAGGAGLDALAIGPELRAMLADALEAPPWLDPDAVERGARAFRRFGSAVFRFAGSITLAGYLEASVAKPLALSGAYVGAGTRERFLETVAFWIEVSEPGGLDVTAPGFAAALRVRLVHATVRVRLDGHSEWQTERWGVPINTGDALLTLMGGSLAPGLGMRVLGFRPSRADIEAMLHFWRRVGQLMGIRFSPYPETVEDALRVAWIALFKGSQGAGEDGRALCRSYDEAFAPEETSLRGWLEHGLHRGMTALFLPRPIARAQGLPPAGLWALVPLLPFPLVFGMESLRRRVPALDALADELTRRERRAWLARHTKGRAAAFRAPAGLRR